MSVSLKTARKTLGMFALAGLSMLNASCDKPGTDPGTDPGPGTGPTTGLVHSIKGKITGLDINVVDSTVSIRTGGFSTPAEVILSAKKNANGGLVNLGGALLDEDNLIVKGDGLIRFNDYNKSLTVSSAEEGKKHIGFGINNNDKIDILDAQGINYHAGIEAGDRSIFNVTKDEVVGILKQPLKVIGAEAKGIGGPQKTYKIAIN